MGDLAFDACENLSYVSIPSTIISMAGGKGNASYRAFGAAFLNCRNLSNVNIPNDIRNLRVNPFIGCSNLFFKTKYYICKAGKLKLSLAGKLAGLECYN